MSAASRRDGLRLLARRLGERVGRLRFAAPVAHVYNPLRYAWPMTEAYLDRFGAAPGRALLLGMNPGPWGMMQTGVPFGDPLVVGQWMGLRAAVRRPRREHPRVPVRGLASPRREGSGKRLWGWAAARYGGADAFFARAFVWNYCPLGFLDARGANLTPDALGAEERRALLATCDRALAELVALLQPRVLVGIGVFAEARLRAVVGAAAPIHRLLHPSPASPLANQGWDRAADELAAALGL
jgi:single-strand selective monofunctional uracil DNA glycosylase